jgi:hypothetical protein
MLTKAKLLEDLAIGMYLTQQGFPGVAMAGNNFIGHDPRSSQFNRLAMGMNMPECSSLASEWRVYRAGRCGRFFTPLNEVVFLHMHPFHGFPALLKLADAYFNAPPWVMWYNGWWGCPRFCREENVTARNESSFWNSPRVEWKENSWY